MLLSTTKKENGIDEESAIVTTTQRAIDHAAEGPTSENIFPLKETTGAMCFFVHSDQAHGFVLCSIAESLEPLPNFISVFKSKLREYMSEFDKEFTVGEPVEVTLPAVDFSEWAKDQADFFKKFVHLDRECGIAFFGLQIAPPKTGPSVRDDMVCIHIADVQPDRQLLFDVYLHLPINKKFLHYSREGRQFSKKQKQRLMDGGINVLHLPQGDVGKLHRYHIEAYLDQKIAEHIGTKTSKNAG
jgi:hypothetical protein